jgi:hypothetical protein
MDIDVQFFPNCLMVFEEAIGIWQRASCLAWVGGCCMLIAAKNSLKEVIT